MGLNNAKQPEAPEKENTSLKKVEALEKENTSLKKELDVLKNEKRQQGQKGIHNAVSANESNHENVNIQVRPMKIAEEYTNFCTDAWMEAKEAMDEAKACMSEIDKIEFLCKIITVAGEEAHTMHEDVLWELQARLEQPIMNTSRVERENTRDLPMDVYVPMSDHYRKNADKIDSTKLVQSIKSKVLETSPKQMQTIFDLPQVDAYMKQAALLAWKMSIQRPSMTFDTPEVGKSWKGNSEKYKLEAHYGSEHNHPQAVIICYVYPILYHESKIQGRTKVIVGPKDMELN